MRFLTIAILALLLSLGAAAQPTASGQLADYVPPDVLMYAEFKIDDATVSDFDSLIANLTDRVGIEDVPTLDGIVQILGLRQWLGGRAAVAVLPSASVDGLGQNAMALIRIRDRVQVEAFLREQYEPLELPSQGGATLYALNGLGISVTDDLVIAAVGLAGAALPLPGGRSLSTHQPYIDALAALPAGDYAATAYLDPQGLVFALASGAPGLFNATAVNLPALLGSLGVWSAGVVQLDDRSYALDVAHLYGARHIFEALYTTAPPTIELTPIDPDWLSLLPDDVVFVGQVTRPWAQFRTLLEAVSIGGNAIRTRAFVNAAVFENVVGFDPVRSPLTLLPPSLSSTAVLNTLEGIFNMTDAELTAAFDGQALAAAGFRATSGTPALEFLFAVESASLTDGQKIVNGIRSILPLLNIAPSESGDDQMLFEAHGPLLQSPLHLLADFNALYFGSDALILADKQTLVAVPRLTESDVFEHDRALFLPDATNLAYLHLPPVRELFESDPDADAVPEFFALLDLFDSFWISARAEASRSVARIAFTLTP